MALHKLTRPRLFHSNALTLPIVFRVSLWPCFSSLLPYKFYQTYPNIYRQTLVQCLMCDSINCLLAPAMSSLKWTLARARTELTVNPGLHLLKVSPALLPLLIQSEDLPGLITNVTRFLPFLLFAGLNTGNLQTTKEFLWYSGQI